MTDQTPKERLEGELRCVSLGEVPDSPMFERIRSAAIIYIKHAEARIKELEFQPVVISDFLRDKISPEAFAAFEKHIKELNDGKT